jgi:hypothetical protein
VTELAGDPALSIARVGNSFACVVMGKLRGSCLEAGRLIFEDDILQRGLGYLDGKTIAMNIDRIDVEFLVC